MTIMDSHPQGCGCAEKAAPGKDRAAFLDEVSRLVHEHRASLVAVARAEGLEAEDAFDVVQEAFHGFIERAEPVTGGAEGARKLLVTLTRNQARNRRRLHAVARPHESGRLDGLPAGDPSVEELMTSAEEHVRLAGCLRTLGDVQRAVVTLRMLDEAPGDSVARTLGISPGHVAVLLHRAKANLLACMTSAE
jgi:RNA polymerase sigma-70 factor (ECF subfamily)